MSGRVYCPECGASYADPFESLDVAQCGARLSGAAWCKGRLTSAEKAIRSLARARATAHAAGYAEAVADVVAMMRDHVRRAENVMRKSHFDRGPFDSSTLQAGAYVRGAAWGIDQIADGAHVGAAKKGGGG